MAARPVARLAVPDLVSPSYFPAIAAVELGCLAEQGIHATMELRFPVTDAATALRDGEIDFLAGAAHAPLAAFPGWEGVRLLMALSHHTYWFLVVRADFDGGLADLRDMRIGAAPGPDLGLLALLEDAGVHLERNRIEVAPIPTGGAKTISFGVMAADALAAGAIDGFWANGMGAELAVRRGDGRLLLDARRATEPARAPTYTFPALAATTDTVRERPELVEAVVRGVIAAQHALREDPERATEVGKRLFPPVEAGVIAELIARDAPYYDPEITPAMVADLNTFAARSGMPTGQAPFERVVAVQFTPAWRHASPGRSATPPPGRTASR
jgi:NitT/TauT family transport system substrate-binding protein